MPRVATPAHDTAVAAVFYRVKAKTLANSSANSIPLVDVYRHGSGVRHHLLIVAGWLPDGKLLAVRCLVDNGDLARLGVETDRLFVVDARGAVQADIDTFKE
jgi:hypothetical protein